MNKRLLLTSFIFLLMDSTLFAKASAIDSFNKKDRIPVERFYIGNTLDAAIFSTATIQYHYPGTFGTNSYTTNNNGTIRFTLFINYGFTFNFNLNRHFGIYTGIDLKNIGFIEQNSGGETVKRRTYNLGAPLGIKIGNMRRKGNYLLLGGGLDLPINYKEKEFTIRSQKSKFNEWFSTRTPLIMPYVFLGAKIKSGYTFKFQYYPNNFLNPDYVASNGAKPYYGYNVHLLLLSIGYNLHLGKHKDMVKSNITTLHTNTL